MDHRDISNAVDSTCLLGVGGRATREVSSSFCVWYVKRALRIWATKMFRLSYSHIQLMSLSLSLHKVRNSLIKQSKVKFTLEQATKVQKGSRSMALLFL
jgi:hypothetical protein